MQTYRLNLSWPCSAFRKYVISLILCKLVIECLVTLVCSQVVCDLLSWVQTCMLIFSPTLSDFREYVILSIGCKPACWLSCGLVLAQRVCNLVNWVQPYILNIFWPWSALRQYVILSIECKLAHWMSPGLVLSSVCMWSCQLGAYLYVDCLVALLCSQLVCDLFKSTNLHVECLMALRKYVMLLIGWKPACWMPCDLGLPSESK